MQLETHQHLLSAEGDMLLITNLKIAGPGGNSEPVAAGNADDAAFSPDGKPVASFKAPLPILSLQRRGATICVECEGGAVCILLAPFLAV
jgi:hypothetical protein